MATIVFLLKRFLAQRLLGLAIVVTLGFTIGVLVAGPIYADAAREAILSSELRTAAVTVKNIRFQLYAGADLPAGRIDAAVRSATGAIPLDRLVRQGLGALRLGAPGREPLSFKVLFRDGAADHLQIRGEIPQGPGQIAIPASVARLLRVRIGEEVVALGPSGEQARLTVTGTFPPPHGDQGYWYGGGSPFPPPESSELPPAIMDRDGYVAAIPRLGVTTEWAWDAYIDHSDLTFEEASRLPGVIAAADRTLRGADPALASLQTQTGLPTLIELVRQRVADLRVPIFLVVFQIGAVTLAVLAGVGSLVLTRQSFELAVLRSRGFSRAKLLGGQAVQAALSALLAFPIGLLLGMGLAKLASNANGPSLPGVLFPIRLTGLAQALGIAGAAVGAGTLLLLSLPHVRRTILEERRLLSREERPLLARVPVELFVAPVALFAFLQLRTGADATVRRGSLDPLVLLTPTLIIFTLSFLSLRLLVFVLRRLDRRLGRSRRLPVYLAARRLGRSPGTSFATSLLLVLSFGLLVVSTSYRAVMLASHEDSAHQQVGADWNVQVAVREQPLAMLGRLPDDATGVIRTEPSFDHPETSLLEPVALAIDPATYGDAGWWRTDYSKLPLRTWLAALDAPDPAVLAGADTLTAQLTADAGAVGLQAVVTYGTAAGEIRRTEGPPIEEGTDTYTFQIPGAERVLSIAFLQEGVGGLPGSLDVGISSVRLATVPLRLEDWQPLRWRGSDGAVSPSDDGIRSTIEPGVGHIVGGIAPPVEPLPALVSPGLARALGPEFEATVGGQLLTFRRVGAAGHFPSLTGDFLVTSAPALLRATARVPEAGLSLNEVWAMGDDPRPDLERSGFLIGDTQAAGPTIGALAQLPESLAVGLNFAVAAGGLGLVVIGVAAGLYFAQRRRAFEFASLRAMGAEPRQIARVLLLEQGAMIAFAIVVGAGLGYGVLRLLMPYLGRSIATPVPEPLLGFDWASLGVGLAAIVAATAVGLLAALRALLRASVTSVLRGEAE